MKRVAALLYVAAVLAAQPVTVRDLDGNPRSFDLRGHVTVVAFISTVCPISNDYNDRMIALNREYAANGVQLLFVNPNHNESVREIRRHIKVAEFPFPVYRDEGNPLADRFAASITPEFFVLDAEGVVRYQGQFDDARNPARVQFDAVRQAIDELLAGKPVTRAQTKAFGCIIKRVRQSAPGESGKER